MIGMVVGDSRGGDDWLHLPHAALVSTLVTNVSSWHFSDMAAVLSDGLDDRRHKRPDNRHDVCFNQSRVAGNLGGMAVATQIVMDRTGDTRHHFDAKDSQALAKAEERFKELMRLGFTAAVRTAASEVTRVRSFDPTAEETLFFPRLVGG
jgi:hypothetical protein